MNTKDKEISFDNTRLAILIEDSITRAEFARLMHISRDRLDRLLDGEIEFTQGEIIRAARILSISAKRIGDYFFTPKVQNI